MASKDQAMGAGILGVAIILIVVYIWALFFSPIDMIIGGYPLRFGW